MEIPESIEKITTTVAPSQFTVNVSQNTEIIQPVIDSIRQFVAPTDYRAFEEGSAWFKQNIFQDKNFIKNLLNLYADAAVKSISQSTIDADIKAELAKTYLNNIKSVASSIENLHTLINVLNKDQNFIDVRKISYIILGYVIDTIKKCSETRS